MDSRLFVFIVCWWCVLPDKSQGQTCRCNSTTGGCNYTNQCVPINNCSKENVALGKYANLSSVYTDNKYPACQAVNGNTGRQYVPNGDANSNCANSGDVINSQWEVDLGKSYTIDSITVYTMDGSEIQMYGVLISVDGISCYNITTTEIPEKLEVTCNTTLKGQHVQFLKYDYTGNFKYISFCEVQVWAKVCKEGFFGPNCSNSCGHCRFNQVTCDPDTGHCPGGCQSGWHLPICLTACTPGLYGVNCSNSCGKCIHNQETCDRFTGDCPAGCQSGWQPPTCHQECTYGSYGVNCSNSCGNCINNQTTCDRITGYCPGGCQSGWQPPQCYQECAPGLYGVNCSNSCGNCFNNQTTCDRSTGHCPGGCQSGWQPPKCHEGCTPGLYGVNCSNSCGNCINNQTTCDRITGHCPGGCQSGRQPPTCHLDCAPGLYGVNCSNSCGNCINNQTSCDRITGICPGGCQSGWQPPSCHLGCDEHYYGYNCSNTCGHCIGGTCNNVNGECTNGCEPGYTNITCDEECYPGLYGTNCTEQCGHCLNNVACNPVNGMCEVGCREGFAGLLCKVEVKDSEISGGVIAGIAVGVVAAVVFVAAFTIIFIRYRRLKSQNSSKCQHSEIETNQTKSHKLSDTKGAKPKAAVKPHMYSEKTGNNGSDTHLYSSPDDKSSEEDVNASNIYINIRSSRNTLTESEVGYVVPTCQVQTPLSKTSASNASTISIAENQDAFTDDKDIIYNNEEIYATYSPVKAAVQMDALQRSLLTRLSSGLLSKQFKELPRGTKHPCTEGTRPENVRKNRFKALCPYDHTRVKLHRLEGDKGNDYINASYVKGFQRDKAYIATQGPRIHTVDDFWLMIWQENATQIVMLTNLTEDGKEKCEEYWPATGATQTYSHVSVTGLNIEQRADFIIRTFSLKFQDKPFQRQVDQYHFVTWPDHGVPIASSLVNFWRYIKGRALPNVPLVVHCSAGVGRTGTYIALDFAMEMAARRRDVNVHNIVVGLREDRNIMVQAEAQYKFLYEVILEAYTSRASRLTFDQFEVMFTNAINIHESNDVIDKEFKVLQQMGEYVPKPSNDVATAKENLAKNRNPNVLPDDKFLAYLSVPVQGRNFYINAVFLSSFKHQRGIILTQLPLPDTLVDIWRLVDDKDVNTIVALISKNEEDLAKDFCQYWPKAAGEVLKIGPYSLMATTSTLLTKHVTSFHMQFKTKSRTRDVRLLHFWNWTGEVPEDTSDLIHLVENLHSNHPEEDHSPVLIQCIDGAAKSGLFCILWEIISRAMCDHELDVYLAARHVQRVRPQAVTSQVQYRYCYRVAQDFQRHCGVYQNT